MPLDPQFRAVLDGLQSAGLVPLVRGDARETRAHYRTLAMRRRGPEFVPEQVAAVSDERSPAGVPVRVYVPFGRDWFRYWMRRVAESRGA